MSEGNAQPNAGIVTAGAGAANSGESKHRAHASVSGVLVETNANLFQSKD